MAGDLGGDWSTEESAEAANQLLHVSRGRCLAKVFPCPVGPGTPATFAKVKRPTFAIEDAILVRGVRN
jgi:hypothetical protein